MITYVSSIFESSIFHINNLIKTYFTRLTFPLWRLNESSTMMTIIIIDISIIIIIIPLKIPYYNIYNTGSKSL